MVIQLCKGSVLPKELCHLARSARCIKGIVFIAFLVLMLCFLYIEDNKAVDLGLSAVIIGVDRLVTTNVDRITSCLLTLYP